MSEYFRISPEMVFPKIVPKLAPENIMDAALDSSSSGIQRDIRALSAEYPSINKLYDFHRFFFQFSLKRVLYFMKLTQNLNFGTVDY